MKTLYEILEVSETASEEMIGKAYRVLAKKYHPDLQPPEKKEDAEKKMKEINEAYSTLSDETKRKAYDEKLAIEKQAEEAQRAAREQANNNYGQSYYNANTQRNYDRNEQDRQQTEQQYYTGQQNQSYANRQQAYYGQRPMTEDEYKEAQRRQQEAIREQQRMQEEIERNIQAQYEQKYQQAYENYLRSLGYRIKYKWTWKNYRDFLITILVIIAVCVILWLFPPTHKLIIDFYNSNPIFKIIIDIIFSIFKGIWNTICLIFK